MSAPTQTTLYDLAEAAQKAASAKFGPTYDSQKFEIAYLIGLLRTHRVFLRTPWGVELKLEIPEA